MPKDLTEACRWYYKSASLGFPKAEYYLGLALFSGEGIEADKRKALHWIGRSAEHGHDASVVSLIKFCLGSCDCEHCVRTRPEILRVAYVRNLTNASQKNQTEWIEKLAQSGHTKAQFFLGQACLEGKRVEQDIAKGIKLLASAGNNWNFSAQQLLSTVFQDGKYVAKNKEEADKWLQMSRRQLLSKTDSVLKILNPEKIDRWSETLNRLADSLKQIN